jgi:hypothetical protein
MTTPTAKTHACDCNTKILGARIHSLEKMLAERDLRYTERFMAQEKAERLFMASLDSWKAHTNEWRGAMEDRERRFLSKAMGSVIGALTIAALAISVLTKILPEG